jgi:hypothetical protein
MNGLAALDMVELNVELLAHQYEEAKEAAKNAAREAKILREKMCQIMDLQGSNDMQTSNWSIWRTESVKNGLMTKKELQTKYGVSWIEENTVKKTPTVTFYVSKKVVPDTTNSEEE